MSAPEQAVDANFVIEELCTEVARLNRELAIARAHIRMLQARDGQVPPGNEAMKR